MGSGTSVEDNRTEVIEADGIMRPMRLLLLVLALAADKELHFAGSLAISASLRVEGRSRRDALATTFAVGLLKETYDVALKPKRLKRGASWKDLAADLAGALAGVALVRAMD